MRRKARHSLPEVYAILADACEDAGALHSAHAFRYLAESDNADLFEDDVATIIDKWQEDRMAGGLAAYGHLNYTVGDEDFVVCADFIVFRRVSDGVLRIAWELVVDSGNDVSKVDSGVFNVNHMRADYYETWCPLWDGADIVIENEVDYDPADLEATCARWVRDLRAEISRVGESS